MSVIRIQASGTWNIKRESEAAFRDRIEEQCRAQIDAAMTEQWQRQSIWPMLFGDRPIDEETLASVRTAIADNDRWDEKERIVIIHKYRQPGGMSDAFVSGVIRVHLDPFFRDLASLEERVANRLREER